MGSVPLERPEHEVIRMTAANHPWNRRDFLKSAGAMGTVLGIGAPSRVLGANNKIRMGTIGVGGRGSYVTGYWSRIGEETGLCEVVAVCDVYQKRLDANKKHYHCDAYQDYKELLARNDIDAVYIATPDHWHARIAIDALNAGKDVYVEKPMTHTIEEAHLLVETVEKTGRVLQVGSQTTSGQQWWLARKAIADGMIGQMVMSQGSYHRNSVKGEWNYPIDQDAGPSKIGEEHIDWETWLGPAPERRYDPDRYFNFRKFWDYSGGIATDLFYHVVAPMNICWGEPRFPHRVTAGGGIYVFHDREVPDTFHLIGDYKGKDKKGFSLVLTSSMANSQHIPGMIRGHLGTVIMTESGKFESYTPYITVRPDWSPNKNRDVIDPEYAAKWGTVDFRFPVKRQDVLEVHIKNFLECVHTRKKPHLDVVTGAKTQVLISMSVLAYRQNKVLYFDEKNWKVLDHPPEEA